MTKTVSLVLDLLEERNLLLKRDESDAPDVDAALPKDNRARVVEELLETERKYVQYLEILQVCYYAEPKSLAYATELHAGTSERRGDKC